MAKDESGELVLASPFKFGFFAGLGFFFASVLMSFLSIVCVAVIGIGTIGSLLVGGASAGRWKPSDATAAEPQTQSVEAMPAASVVTPRPTYHRKPRAVADE